MSNHQNHFCSLIVSTVTMLVSSSCLFAEAVYKWEDSQGIVHFSSKAPSKDAKPAQLPNIMRGEVKLAQQKLISCEQHGGINCKAGADTDGSVICYDGFRAASTRFRFSCSAPKLEVADISEANDKGEFSVFVRNSRSVSAKKPAVVFKKPDGTEATLTGPAEIEAFGLAEFAFKSDAPQGTGVMAKPDFSQLTIACANCP